MNKHIKSALALAFGASLALSATACSSSPAENEAGACTAYNDFVAAVAGVQATVDGSSSVGEIREAREKVATTYKELEGNLDKVSADRKQALADSWEQLNKKIEDLDKDLSVPEAKAAISDELAALKSAQTSANTDLKC
ncbi:hypothetical protein [Glutamicibacter protophormiae]|uniref:Lipoprotein n=1 Tax=Glutamicibacter protophormiae TaxID=37930 RepID=A0ABS4XQK8_GLUPR|nr:hypothetical protein [Glutamicibacter protophormiae]MBP2398630.1 hypothetical protein [Glutamicibacter protophormiae]GGL81192.1 hypothetical protein GCM10010038_08930 [Glutamicibacter protophormiae]